MRFENLLQSSGPSLLPVGKSWVYLDFLIFEVWRLSGGVWLTNSVCSLPALSRQGLRYYPIMSSVLFSGLLFRLCLPCSSLLTPINLCLLFLSFYLFSQSFTLVFIYPICPPLRLPGKPRGGWVCWSCRRRSLCWRRKRSGITWELSFLWRSTFPRRETNCYTWYC